MGELARSLMSAVIAEDHDVIRTLVVDRGARLNPPDDSRAPLSVAVRRCSPATVSLLINLGADPLHPSFGRYDSILGAAAGHISRDPEVLSYVLSLPAVRALPEAEYTAAVKHATWRDNLINAEQLIFNGAGPEKALYDAAVLSPRIMRLLITEGGDVETVDHPSGLSVVEFALHRQFPHPLAYARLPDRSNCFYVAVFKSDLDCLYRHAETGRLDQIPTIPLLDPPLILAAEHSEGRVIEWLLGHGFDPTVVSPVEQTGARIYGGRTILHAASARDRPGEWLARFVALGADPNRPDGRGHPPLHHAIIHSRWDAARHLLDLGADPNRVTPRGTVGHLLVLRRNLDLLDQLLIGQLDLEAKYPSDVDLGRFSRMSVRALARNELGIDLRKRRQKLRRPKR